jgi:hypothetical protein
MERNVGPNWGQTRYGEEMEKVKALGDVLDESDLTEARARVREVLKGELIEAPPMPARRRVWTKLTLVAATIAVVFLGGIAVASNFGAGVDDPPEEKIPFVHETIEKMEQELSALDTSTAEGAAEAEYLNDKLTVANEVLDRLCAAAGLPPGC